MKVNRFVSVSLATLSVAVVAGGVALAAGTTNLDSLRVGTAGEGGVTFFNGSIVNEGEAPVTIADNLRVDGRISRLDGQKDKPVIIADDLIVEGTIRSDQPVKTGYTTIDHNDVISAFTLGELQPPVEGLAKTLPADRRGITMLMYLDLPQGAKMSQLHTRIHSEEFQVAAQDRGVKEVILSVGRTQRTDKTMQWERIHRFEADLEASETVYSSNEFTSEPVDHEKYDYGMVIQFPIDDLQDRDAFIPFLSHIRNFTVEYTY